jgi:hypothetical protein
MGGVTEKAVQFNAINSSLHECHPSLRSLDRVPIEQYILNRRDSEGVGGELLAGEVSVRFCVAFASGIKGQHRPLAVKAQ